MSELALLIDFGSTYTKVTAIDPAAARVLGRAQAPSTVATDVCEGLLNALLGLEQAGCSALAGRPRDIDALLTGAFVRASSSAAGGLRIVVVGLVPGLTVEAANAAALGAGGKIVGAFGFKLHAADIAEIAKLKPDMVLLTGGTDGGDTQTICHNAAGLARSTVSVPFVVAGNSAARAEVHAILAAAGKNVTSTDNVMPQSNVLRPEPAQEKIRQIFMREIVRGKGLDRIGPHVPIVLATPVAVLTAAIIGSQGIAEEAGCGDLLLVDVGGATTDVHSIGMGRQIGRDIIQKELPEPFAKRTVEGDLGLRSNAATIVKRVGEEEFLALFRDMFPTMDVDRDALFAHIGGLAEETDRLPQTDWQAAADAVLARAAVDIAIARHVGTREPHYAREGAVFIQSGKDLSETRILVGTGGIFLHNPYADRILTAGASRRDRCEILRPADPQILLDSDYILYAIGLLAESHPEVALRIFQDRLRVQNTGVVTVSPDGRGALVDHGPFCSCCSDLGLPYIGPEEGRVSPRRVSDFRAEPD